MQAMFKVGDVIKRRDGDSFSNGLLKRIITQVDLVRERYHFNTTLAPFEYAHKNYCLAHQDEDQVVQQTPGPVVAPSQAFKADAGKPRWSLLMTGCASALAGVVRVLTFAVKSKAEGGKGYLPHSWKGVDNATERYKDALFRHLNKIELGETHDDESGELHWHHIATNALFLAELNKDTPNANSK